MDITNILDEAEINSLFDEEDVQDPQPVTEEQEDISTAEDSTENPESVGSEDQEEEEGTNSDEDGSSPNNSNFYSSIASALAEEGTFQFLDDTDLTAIKDADAFKELFEREITARLDDTNKRIYGALTAGMEVSEVQKYENTLSYLNSISEDSIKDESEEGEKIRKQLIYTEMIQRGYSEERAKREVKKSFDAGNDIDDAMDALDYCKSSVTTSYDSLVKEAKEEAKKIENNRKQMSEDLKKSMLNSETFFDGLKVDKTTRQKAYDSVSTPSFRTKDGNEITAIQKYQAEHPIEFMANLGMIFTLTDGFTKLDKLVGERVKKEKKNGLRQLEKVINTTERNTDGSLRYSNGSDRNASFNKNDSDLITKLF